MEIQNFFQSGDFDKYQIICFIKPAVSVYRISQKRLKINKNSLGWGIKFRFIVSA
jgi:hypothetical protein